VTDISFTDTTVTNGTTYYYVVSTVNFAGEGALSAEVSAATPMVTVSPGPSPLVVQSGGSGLTLSWMNGTLQSATNLAGPWDDVVGAAPPTYTVVPIDPQRYFKLR
jgi:cellulose 1,4-beta-cellobiosidase